MRECPRCGLRRTTNPHRKTSTGLCRDCRDVAITMGELRVWAA
jgi:hypothetical protein